MLAFSTVQDVLVCAVLFPPNVQVVSDHVLVRQKCCRIAVGHFPRSFLKGTLGIQEWLRKGVAVIAFPLWDLAAGVEGSIVLHWYYDGRRAGGGFV